MEKAIPDEVMQEITSRGVFGVLEIQDECDALPVAEALYSNGITAIELALRTEASIPAMKRIHEAFPDMFITAGTVHFPEQLEEVIAAGASMGVAPGFNPHIVRRAAEMSLPFAPGISTASEVEAAYSEGCRLLKLFPAEPLGGIKYMKSMMGPYSYLGIKLFPLGGLSQDNLASWAAEPNIAAVGGSWIASKDLIRKKDFDEIGRRAKAASETWKSIRGGNV